jgi:hypothetical protein
MRNSNAAAIKQIRKAIAPFLKYPNCSYSNRIFSDKCKQYQSYKLPKLTDNNAAIAAIAALDIPNLTHLRIFNATCFYPYHTYQTVRFALPHCN